MSRTSPGNSGRGSTTAADRRARMLPDRQLFARYFARREPAAREELVERFLPLATLLARRYRHGAEPVEDLVQVASLGLLNAIDRFDPERGTAFASFAVPTIAGELKRYFRDKGWAARVPRDLQDQAQRVERTADRVLHELGRAPTVSEIAEELGITLEQVLEAREAAAAHRAESLDRPYGHDEDATTLADTLGAAEPGYVQAEQSATLEAMMSILSDRDREILRLRFKEDLTQSEIGQRVGVSQMHVSRLLREMLARLRDAAQPSENPAATGASISGRVQLRL